MNAKVRRQLLWDSGHSRDAAVAIRKACAEDILFFVNVFAWTYDPRLKEGRVPFVTYGFQDDAILAIKSAIEEQHDIGIAKSRDMGASWIISVVFVWFFLFVDNRTFLMVSRNEDYVDKSGNPKCLFWKLDFLIKNLPEWLRPQINRSSMHMENLENGSVIDGESTTSEVGRGDRRTAIMLDEFAAFDTNAAKAVMGATQSATYCRVFNSTPKGVGNSFYDVMHRLEGVERLRLHWSSHPLKNKGLYKSRDGKVERLDDWKGLVEIFEDGKKKTVLFPDEYPFRLDGHLRSPWYDRECDRCASPQEIAQELDIDFAGSDYTFFDGIKIEEYKALYCFPPVTRGDIEYDRDTGHPSRFGDNDKGRMMLWQLPDYDGGWACDRRFVVGVDVSAGTGASNSAVVVYDRQTSDKIAEYTNPNILPMDFARLVHAVAEWFNNAIIVPDRSGPTGEIFVKELLAEGYTTIYRRRNDRKIGRPVTDEAGVWLNPAVRTTILEQYRDAINTYKVINRSRTAMDECLQFIRRKDGSIEHQASAYATDPSNARTAHGDIAIADALATMELIEGTGLTMPAPAPNMPESCLKRRMDARALAEKKATEDRLGEGW